MSYADEYRELAERDQDWDRMYESQCTTEDELREVRMGIVPTRVQARLEATYRHTAIDRETVPEGDHEH